MLHLFLIILSYAAFLPLVMPSLRLGILAFIGGTCFVIAFKLYKIPFWKNRVYSLISISAFLAGFLAMGFYQRQSVVTTLYPLGNFLHMPFQTVLLLSSLVLAVASVYFIYALLQTIYLHVSPRYPILKSLVSCVVVSAFTVMSGQVMLSLPALSMGYWNFFWGVLIVSIVILLLYGLLRRIVPATVFGAGFFMVISTINVYVYRFRERLLDPVDIFSARTAMNVVENYSFLPIPINILSCWGIFLFLLALVFCLNHNARPAGKKRYAICILLFCIIGSTATAFFANNLRVRNWHTEGALYNGYVLNFVSRLKYISVSKPDQYRAELVDELAEQYVQDGNADSEDHPHIIVIMDESFADLSVIGELATNTEVTPFLSSLKENTISGYALASIYGGNTANSEYEFLTGNSMAWLPPNTVPYQRYLNSATYSMVSYLKSFYNYKCLAMHPFSSSGWNRPAAYEHLGFDACYFIEDFPQENLVREFISDQEMFEFLIDTFESQKEDPLFLYGVTMQNHGDYTYTGENYVQHISLQDYAYPDVEQYLSLIHETDKAAEYLISYFENVEEEVVIVFFGDHLPKLPASFFKTVSGTEEDTLDKQQQRYKVPFLIWANYDIAEAYIDCTSLNYLSSYVYEAAGISLPAYNQFLRDMEEVIPSINTNGFYSPSAGRYLSFEEATGDEQHWLELYEILQYNSLFDKKNQNSTFFPTLP